MVYICWFLCENSAIYNYMILFSHFAVYLPHFRFDFKIYNDSVSRLEGFVSNREQSYEDPIEE